jgi:alpha-ribazole phosphatase
MTTPPITRWWWVRHGPVHNPDRRLYGQNDIDAHFPDADALAALRAQLPDDALWLTSSLKRTHQTAAALGRDLADCHHHPTLNEQHFGDWQGLDFASLKQLGPDFERLWNEPGETRPPGGESFADVLERVAETVTLLTAEHAGRDIVAIAHGGSIRAALALALGLDARSALGFRIDTLSLTRIDHVPRGAEPSPGSLTRWQVGAVNLSR